MEEKFLSYFSRFRVLTEEEKEAIVQDLNIGTFKKGTHLLKAGQAPLDNYFVLQGCVRKYYLKEGEESITNFYTEEDWILPAIGGSLERKFDYSLECIEDSVLVIGNEDVGNELTSKFPKLLELSQRVLEKEFIKQQQQLVDYQNSTPEERYVRLQQEHPELMDRIPQYHLSSYIGVKPESLSRIRKRLAKKRTS